MKTLSLSVTEDTYRSARVWARQCNTSISALVRIYLEILHNLPCPGVVARDEDANTCGEIDSSPVGTSLPL
jgi:hypothetical protein